METAHSSSQTGETRRLVKLLLSLAVVFIAAEIVGLNRYLRTVIEGHAFWIYIASLLLIAGFVLGVSVLTQPDLLRLAIWKVLASGFIIGFLAGLASILVTPLLQGKGLHPTLNALNHPSQFLAAGFFSMGWLYGLGITWVSQTLARGKYRHIAYFVFCCACMGTFERLLDNR